MTHRDGIARFSARSVRRGDAEYREACATLPEDLAMPPFRSPTRSAGGCQKRLMMPRITCAFLPARRTAWAISMGYYQCSLV